MIRAFLVWLQTRLGKGPGPDDASWSEALLGSLNFWSLLEGTHLLMLMLFVGCILAVDLRLIVAALRINSDLERIADHAVNIAECAERMSTKRPFKPWVDVPMMADTAREMLKDSLDAFVRRDTALALEVCERDDILDERNKGLIRELLTYMAENPALISYCIEIMSVSKNLERVGDLATNICEGTIYFVQGRVIKHSLGPKHEGNVQ